MLKKLLLLLLICPLYSVNGQVIIYPDTLVESEQIETTLCYNNSSLMVGNSLDDRYLLYYNEDTIFLNVNQSQTWTRKIAHIGNGISSATIAFHNDSIWVCWKEATYIKTRYSIDKGTTWDTVLNVSPAGNVAAPSIYAASNGKVHFVWHNQNVSDTIVQHNVYSNGSFLSSPNTLSTPSHKATWAAVTAIGDTVLCTWKESNGTSKIYFSRSFNGGATGSWLASSFTNGANTGKDSYLSYAFDESSSTHYLYLAYDGNNKIYLQRSTDFGDNWSTPEIISYTGKNSQFAKVESNNSGFVGVSWEHRTGVSLFDDTKKDVGFSFSTDWGSPGSFGNDSLAYTYNPFGSPLASFNKIDENNFYLVWLSNDTIQNRNLIYERRIGFDTTVNVPKMEKSAEQLIQFFPNPSSSWIKIQSNSFSPSQIELIILDIFGKEVYQHHINSKEEIIDVSFLNNGIYFIQASGTNDSRYKFILQK